MSKPITPNEIDQIKISRIPEIVFDTFNNEIIRNFSDNSAIVKQEDIIQSLIIATGVNRDFIFANGWLDIEKAYRAAGWKVVYGKPGYDAFYKFSK